MAEATSLTILLSTYNRSQLLRETLGTLGCLDREGLRVELVVVDNNSADDTKSVIESFQRSIATDPTLAALYLFEPRPGKNCALNRALDHVRESGGLGDIVVFTDDDIQPARDWLQGVVAAVARWPEHKIFGGRVFPVWPGGSPPAWANDPYVQQTGFVNHEPWAEERAYAKDTYPVGPNFWTLGEIFATGRRFNEAVGPRPDDRVDGRIMGSETTLLRQLQDEGLESIYVPSVAVGHRIATEQLTPAYVRRRSFRLGRSIPHVEGLCRPDLLRRSPMLWKMLRIASLARGLFGYAVAMASPSVATRLGRSLGPAQAIGFNLESLKLERKERSNPEA